jgi:6-pyruvoyltetrahydropterin/6-carboxytetrahydropterin synthase
MIYITRRERFTAAHKLYQEAWSDEKNKEVFGGCANPNWHGHNYDLFVTVKGKVDAEHGWIIDLKHLSRIINDKVISKVDHRNLNLDVDFMKGLMASTENVAIAIWKELDGEIAKHGAKLHCIKLQETENNYVEYYGE